MHLLVADAVATSLGIRDRGRILLGSLAPDARKSDETHYKSAAHPLFLNPSLNFGECMIKYERHFSDPFFLGYLSHLVMDDVWTMKTEFSGFEARVVANSQIYAQYHEDLRLCNAQLDHYYRPIGLREALLASCDVPAMDEASPQEVLRYKKEALADFEYTSAHGTMPLQLFTLEEMVQYVERSISKACDICRVAAHMGTRGGSEV